MTARVLTGSKQEIAQQLANLPGEVREAIVFVDDSVNAPAQVVPETADDLFREMESYMSKVDVVDDSRETIYTRMDGE